MKVRRPTRRSRAMGSIPPATPHAGGKPGTRTPKILITYVLEKGKPLASPV